MIEYINASPCIHAPGCPIPIPRGVQTHYCGCGARYNAAPSIIGAGAEIEVAFTPSMLRNYLMHCNGNVEDVIKAVWNGREKF